MMNNPRDTQFKRFARLLMDDLFEFDSGAIDVMHDEGRRLEYEQIIARRAYDLIVHAFANMGQDPSYATVEELLKNTPDLMKWPEAGEA